MKPNVCKLLPAVVFTGILFGIPAHTHAAAYIGSAIDQILYTPGALATQDGGTGFNATGNPLLPNTTSYTTTGTVNVTSGSLADRGTLPAPAGNKITASTADTSSTSFFRDIGQTVDSETFYFSLYMQRTVSTVRTVMFGFFEGGTEKFGVGQFSQDASVNNKPNRFNANLFASTNPDIPTNLPFTLNEAYLVIGKVEFNYSGVNDRLTFWATNTAVEAENDMTPFTIMDSANIGAIDRMRGFVGGIAGGNATNFDEIRFGTSWDAVTIPEPSSAALAILALTGLAIRRHLRR